MGRKFSGHFWISELHKSEVETCFTTEKRIFTQTWWYIQKPQILNCHRCGTTNWWWQWTGRGECLSPPSSCRNTWPAQCRLAWYWVLVQDASDALPSSASIHLHPPSLSLSHSSFLPSSLPRPQDYLGIQRYFLNQPFQHKINLLWRRQERNFQWGLKTKAWLLTFRTKMCFEK